MNGRDITELGYREGPIVGLALRIAQRERKRTDEQNVRKMLIAVKDAPAQWASDLMWGELARALIEERDRPYWVEREAPAPYQIWGEGLEEGALMQMRNAVRLPVATSGALMPDAHQGYGLPIGGVLGTENAVIPYAVGVDIACRMKLSVFDVPASDLERLRESLVRILQRETAFGTGAELRRREQHDVMDEDWSVTKITARLKDTKAHPQLGTSGSGNHFVEFGTLTIEKKDLGLEPGSYLALLSHSGSRGSGAQVAQHYSRLAMDLHPELPPDLRYLAWLDMDSEPGQEYWAAMNLMGNYAAANHAVIHRKVAKALGAKVLAGVENHHNFAWKEMHEGKELIVHRKGATPADKNVLGVIPGSMTAPGFIVKGRGEVASVNSAAHGAGRRMSRTAALKSISHQVLDEMLAKHGVKLIGGGLDEAPLAYKDIHEVMKSQKQLVDTVGLFYPKIVKMDGAVPKQWRKK